MNKFTAIVKNSISQAATIFADAGSDNLGVGQRASALVVGTLFVVASLAVLPVAFIAIVVLGR